MRANETNPYGFFEDEEIVGIHDAILEDNGLSWQLDGSSMPVVQEARERQMREIVERRQAGHEVWGFKDPRVCFFLENWKGLLPDARVLLVYRNFVDVISSLHRRHTNGILGGTGRQDFHLRFWEERDLALRMWLAHNRALLGFARAHPDDVVAVSFDMLRKGLPLIEALNRRWRLQLDEVPIEGFFDSKLAPEGAGRQPVADGSLIDEALDVWEELEQLSGETEEFSGFDSGGGESGVDRNSLYLPENAYDLQMENEFLASKVSYLQNRLLEADQDLQRMQTRLDEAEKRRKELEGAEKDLQLIIRRISRSKLAPLARTKEEFRELESRYGE